MTKFDMMCKHFGVTHQFNILEWPSCNGMVERMIKTLKHGFLVVSSSNVQKWAVQVPRILFAYHCGIHNSAKYSPYMILIGRTPRLTIDNKLSNLTQVVDDQVASEGMAL